MYYQLETQRLIIRPWKSSDLADFAVMSRDPQVMRYFPDLLDQQQSQALAQRIQQLIFKHGWGFWAVELKSTQQFIGLTGLHSLAEKFDFTPAVEIGWRFDHRYWRQGFAKEAAKACLAFGFDQLKLDQIYAFTTLANSASESLMQKLGMSFVKHFAHPEMLPDHPLSQHVLYQLDAADFQARRHFKDAAQYSILPIHAIEQF